MASDLIREQVYSDPVAIFGTDYAELQSFFQNSFPPQHLSAQSWGLQETLTDLQKDNLYNSMLAAVGMTDQDIFYSYTLALSSSKDLVTVQKCILRPPTEAFAELNRLNALLTDIWQIKPLICLYTTLHTLDYVSMARILRDFLYH